LTKFEGGLNLLHEAEDDAVIMAGIYGDCSTREINNRLEYSGVMLTVCGRNVVDIVFEDNRDLSEILAKKAIPKKEYFTVPTDDGDGLSFA